MGNGGKYKAATLEDDFMNKNELINSLEDCGLKPNTQNSLCTSGRLIRCIDGETLIVAVGGNENKNDQLHTVVDAVHWHIQTKGTKGKLRVILGKRENKGEMAELLHVSATMIRNLEIPLKVQLEVNFFPCELETAFDENTYKTNDRNWAQLINKQEQKLPELAVKLTELVRDESFRWYRNVTGGYLSGRVDGLQVCTVEGDKGNLDVGKPGKDGDGDARKIFLKVLEKFPTITPGDFDEKNLPKIAKIIKELAELRKNKELSKLKREHLLESRILRNKIILKVDEEKLETIRSAIPFQFPTLWHSNGNARFLDALMCLGNVPWAVELKVRAQSAGEYYRHGITQVVLYREFIKRAKGLHPWFNGKKLDARRCRAALAFPEMLSRQKKILQYHKDVAKAFGVKVIQVDF